MEWPQDLGEQATDILHARLRAKYHGARVITYRPFLLKIMAVSARRQAHSPSNSTYGSQYKEGITTLDINWDAKSIEEIDPTTVKYASLAIRALANSTNAFHRVVNDYGSERFIVTNIWGTAHA
jgi:hypothetical protein